jgi:hypothetical protein
MVSPKNGTALSIPQFPPQSMSLLVTYKKCYQLIPSLISSSIYPPACLLNFQFFYRELPD